MGQFTPAQFASRAAPSFEWAALELDDYDNAPRWPDFRSACLANGIKPGIWVTDGGNIERTPDDAEFAIAELESEGDYLGIMSALGGLPECPLGVVTNFTPLTDAQGVPLPEKAAPLIEAGFVCLPEADLPANINARPDRLAFRAWQLGWGYSQPGFYCYEGKNGNYTLNSYSEWFDMPGWWVWLAETTL